MCVVSPPVESYITKHNYFPVLSMKEINLSGPAEIARRRFPEVHFTYLLVGFFPKLKKSVGSF